MTPIPAKTTTGIPQEGLKLSLHFGEDITQLKSVSKFAGVSKTSDRFGRPEQAIAFSGNGSFMQADVNINPDQMPRMTMAVWVRYTGNPEQSGQIFQVISHDDGGFDRSLGIDARGGQWGWSAFVGSGVIGGLPIQPNEWVFLAVSYDAPAQTADLYLNGKMVSSSKAAETGTGHEFLLLGANPSFVEHFPGDIDDFFLYERKLSPKEVQELYDITKTTPQ